MRHKRRFTNSTPETLEVRQLLSATGSLLDGVLTVVGTSDAESISVSPSGGNMVLKSGGMEESFPLDEVRSVVVRGGEGNDTITYRGAVPSTLDGEGGNDTIKGGAATDLILGGADDDKLVGGGGHDTLVGGTGRDNLNGGGGSDELYALSQTTGETEASDDDLNGGSGRDKLTLQSTAGSKALGGSGKDTIIGGTGDDTLLGQGGNDRLEGGNGHDSIDGNGGNDDLRGGNGNDTLTGDNGNDVITGGGGRDSLVGSAGNDAIDGGDGPDTIIGGDDGDILVGGNGPDTVTGGGADDILIGGSQTGFKNRYRNLSAEWNSSRSYLTRRKNLLDGSGSNDRENGGKFLAVTDDTVADTLIGSASTDMFFANTSIDTVTDNVDGESIEQQGDCSPNAEEVGIANLARNHSGQARASMTCHLTLAEVARARAVDMATRDYSSHTNPDGDGPNQLTREAGYLLPSFYSTSRDANNIESIAFGQETFEEAFDAWMNSNFHRPHLLGTNSFNEPQIEYGVGYAYNANSTFGHYWVFISAYRE